MGLFGLGKKERSTIILIDIGSASVGGAYAHFAKGNPTIYYTARTPIQKRVGESIDDSMHRALTETAELLVREGAPTVRREVGSAHADSILVSVAAPWQETRVRTETLQAVRPFQFTKNLLNETVAKSAHVPEDRLDTGQSVIATILNGYEIPNPFGKQVKRVELVILSSTIAKSATDMIETVLRKAFHSHPITFTGFAPASYQVFRDLYPHEHDYLILDISGEGSDLAFVQRGLLLDVGSIPHGTHALLSLGRAATDEAIQQKESELDRGLGASYLSPGRNARFGARVQAAEEEWMKNLSGILKDFATRHALPRTLFLLADDDVRGFLMRTLDNPSLHTIWLSDEPLRIVPVTPAQFAPYVRIHGATTSDIFMSLLALFHAKKIKPLGVDTEADLMPAPKERPKKEERAVERPANPSIPMSAMVSPSKVDEEEPDFSM